MVANHPPPGLGGKLAFVPIGADRGARQHIKPGGMAQRGEQPGRLRRGRSFQRAEDATSEIQLDSNPQPLKIDSSTQVMLDGKTASADQLQPGSEVRASYTQQSGEAHAIKIEAKSSNKQALQGRVSVMLNV